MNCMWRDIQTGERVCLMGHDHRPRRVRPMVSRRGPFGARYTMRPLLAGLRMLVGGMALAVMGYATMLVIAMADRA